MMRGAMTRGAMTRLMLVAALLLAVPALMPPAGAVEPNEILADPVLEQRARDLSREIRCVVCQNESIDSSNADIARELRLLVRERLVAGDSDQQVFDYLVARYGDFVLLRPPMKPVTYLLWFGPLAILLLGLVAVVVFFRRQRLAADPATALNAEETARLTELLDDSDAPSGAEGPRPS
jgi:cytochrome c-type biogenesis protein CcmH